MTNTLSLSNITEVEKVLTIGDTITLEELDSIIPGGSEPTEHIQLNEFFPDNILDSDNPFTGSYSWGNLCSEEEYDLNVKFKIIDSPFTKEEIMEKTYNECRNIKVEITEIEEI